MRAWRPGLLLSGLVLLLAACGDEDESSLPTGAEPFTLQASDFVAGIDNPYWPMTPGSRWVYHETDAEGVVTRNVVTVTDRVEPIIGVPAHVVHDVATEDGRVVEDTYDWYAQDTDGNVWYFGEDTTAYEEGKPPSKEGSWRAGVDGALPGVAVPADPEVGLRYRQEYLAGEAEDAGEVLSVDERVRVPAGSYSGVLQTKDTTPLEPALVEQKYYAKGVGPVLDETVAGGSDRGVLISFRPG